MTGTLRTAAWAVAISALLAGGLAGCTAAEGETAGVAGSMAQSGTAKQTDGALTLRFGERPSGLVRQHEFKQRLGR